MCGLQSNGVDIWLAFADAMDDDLLARYRILMTAEEQDHQDRFYFVQDRRRDAMTRALVRTTLSLYRPAVKPADWVFETNAHGRPRIRNPEAGPLDFNITHSGSVVALAVGTGIEFGLDLEMVRDCPRAIELADQFFAATEADALRRTHAASQTQRFLEIWTLKESYIKGRGMGLSIPLDKFAFDLDHDETIAFAVEPGVDPEERDWRYFQWLVPDQALFALGVSIAPDVEVGLSLTEALPLIGARPFPCQELRRSRAPVST